MNQEFGNDDLCRACDKSVVVKRDKTGRKEGASSVRSAEPRIIVGMPALVRHAHDAMVRSVPPTAHGQIRLASARHGQKRLNQRQA